MTRNGVESHNHQHHRLLCFDVIQKYGELRISHKEVDLAILMFFVCILCPSKSSLDESR